MSEEKQWQRWQRWQLWWHVVVVTVVVVTVGGMFLFDDVKVSDIDNALYEIGSRAGELVPSNWFKQ